MQRQTKFHCASVIVETLPFKESKIFVDSFSKNAICSEQGCNRRFHMLFEFGPRGCTEYTDKVIILKPAGENLPSLS